MSKLYFFIFYPMLKKFFIPVISFVFIGAIYTLVNIQEQVSSAAIISSRSIIAESPMAALAQAAESSAKNKTEITVYNANLALIKELRAITLQKGENSVKYSDVPKTIDATSVIFTDRTDSKTTILEQEYQYDLVSREKMLEKYLNQKLTVGSTEGNESKSYTGKLLSTTEGVLLETAEGIVSLSNIDKIIFPKLEEGLLIKPTLIWKLLVGIDGKHDIATSYLAGGLSWQADYIAEVSADDDKINLNGWTTIENRSGASFPNSALKLVAGDVNIVQSQPVMMYKTTAAEDVQSGVGGGGGFTESGLFEYHLYTLGRKTDLLDNATKQISLLNEKNIPVEKVYSYDEQKDAKIRTLLKFQNKKEFGLGLPLPAGKIRVYKNDNEGASQFLGEDRIEHTPKDEEIKIFVGKAFDITVEKNRSDARRTGDSHKFGSNCEESDIEVKLKNHKKDDVTIIATERPWGSAGVEILKSSIKPEKISANEYEFSVPVKKDGETKLTYTIKNCF